MCLDLNRLEENFVAIVDCKSQDSVGEISIILRAVPCRKSVFSDRLPTQITVPISPTESWDLHPSSDRLASPNGNLLASFPGSSSILLVFCPFCSPFLWFCYLQSTERSVLYNFRS